MSMSSSARDEGQPSLYPPKAQASSSFITRLKPPQRSVMRYTFTATSWPSLALPPPVPYHRAMCTSASPPLQGGEVSRGATTLSFRLLIADWALRTVLNTTRQLRRKGRLCHLSSLPSWLATAHTQTQIKPASQPAAALRRLLQVCLDGGCVHILDDVLHMDGHAAG